MSHRRRWSLLFLTLLLSIACLAPVVWREDTTLSEDERKLVGKWGYAVTDPGYRFATQAGVIQGPWHVMEFGDDRVFRDWIVSGNDPSHRWAWNEGRWRVVDGRLRFEDFPKLGMRRMMRDARFQIVDTTRKTIGVVLPRGPDRIRRREILFRFPEAAPWN